MYALQVSSHSGEVCKIFSFELIDLLHILFQENKKKEEENSRNNAMACRYYWCTHARPHNACKLLDVHEYGLDHCMLML